MRLSPPQVTEQAEAFDAFVIAGSDTVDSSTVHRHFAKKILPIIAPKKIRTAFFTNLLHW